MGATGPASAAGPRQRAVGIGEGDPPGVKPLGSGSGNGLGLGVACDELGLSVADDTGDVRRGGYGAKGEGR